MYQTILSTIIYPLMLDIGGDNIVTGYSGKTAADSLNNIFIKAGTSIGAVICALAILKIIMATSEENPQAKMNATLMLGAGIFFISLSGVLQVLGVSSSANYSNAYAMGSKIVGIIGSMATYAGGALLALGILSYILAIAQENVDGQQKSTMVIGTSIALFSMSAILKPIADAVASKNISSSTVSKVAINAISGIASYAGGALFIVSIFRIIMSLKDENSQERDKGVKLMAVSVALIAFRSIISFL